MLLLDNETIGRILRMDECLAVLEEAYRQVAAEAALSGTRTDALAPGATERTAYQLKTFSSILPARSVGCVRINSDILIWEGPAGAARRRKLPAAPGNRWVGLLLLFSSETGEPLAVFPDGALQRIRVGAASGLAASYLARTGAIDVAILGAGWQAGGQAMAICAVRQVRGVRVYSPNPERRRAFCREWSEKLGVPFEPMESAPAAVEGVEVALCATNAMQPVLEPEWLSSGVHVGAIRPTELGSDVFSRADLTVVHSKFESSARAMLPAADREEAHLDHGWGQEGLVARMPSLFDLVGGKVAGRTDDSQITCFLNNEGLGIQFAAVGWLVWKTAREMGAGQELPTEWFTQDFVS